MGFPFLSVTTMSTVTVSTPEVKRGGWPLSFSVAPASPAAAKSSAANDFIADTPFVLPLFNLDEDLAVLDANGIGRHLHLRVHGVGTRGDVERPGMPGA